MIKVKLELPAGVSPKREIALSGYDSMASPKGGPFLLLWNSKALDETMRQNVQDLLGLIDGCNRANWSDAKKAQRAHKDRVAARKGRGKKPTL